MQRASTLQQTPHLRGVTKRFHTMSVAKPQPQENPFSRSSIESNSSAAERLRWRDHPQVTSPGFEHSNPFEDGHVHAQDFFPSISEDDDGKEEKNGHSEQVDSEKKIEDEVTGKKNKRKRQKNRSSGEMGVMQGVERESDPRRKLSWRERVRHFTWTWFCMTMATGGIANVLYTGLLTNI